MALTPGTRLGPYEITAPIGAGGMGEVYRGRDPRLGREVAIKVLAPSIMTDAAHLERFAREARAIAALSHPNVLAVFDVGAGDPPFLVTELLQGDTLRAVIDRGRLPVMDAIAVARQIASGLGAAHERGIVHRDLKPANVFVTRDSVVKILDFGVARVAPALQGEAELTREPLSGAGLIVGTVGYMAPEQVRGEPVDGRADLFALGTILFEMLTGRRAFQRSSSAETLTAILHERPRDLAGDANVPVELAQVVDRCLAKNPADRFSTAADLLAALDVRSATGRGGVDANARQRPSVAVLPFVNMSMDAENQYFCDGLAEDLLNALTRLPGLEVASRTSAFRFRGASVDIRQIGQDLHVATVLEGSVRKSGNRLRITAQLINAADGYHLWSERYDREMADVFAIQDEIVESIVHALAPALIGAAKHAVRRPTDDPRAYELYLKGRHYWYQRSPSSLQMAIKVFEQVVGVDPEYALAYTGLADAFGICCAYGWFPPERARSRAREAVERAMAIDPSLAEVHLAQALFLFFFEADWKGSEAALRRAVVLNANLVDAWAYLAIVLANQGRVDEARATIDRACATDPLSVTGSFLSAVMWITARRFDLAERAAERVLTQQPDSVVGRWSLAIAHAAQDRHTQAVELLEQVVAVSRAPFYLGLLGCAYGRAGCIDLAMQLARELDDRESRGEYIVPYARACLAIGRHDVAALLEALSACVRDATPIHSINLVCGPFLQPFLGDPDVSRLYSQLRGHSYS